MENYTGKTLGGRYVLDEVIGIGGMAVVYKAHDTIDNKTVAVKILKDEYVANDDFRKRFKTESRAISVMSHPNIVKVYDVSFGEKLLYIVMEYVEGINLKQYIQSKGKLDWREAVIFTAQILKALHHAHERGVIHRDIKPQNIMLLNDNKTIKVADFGIARITDKSETKTFADGSAIGSVHYISPEQARGEIVDNKTDIYSVGVVLYEMLTGQLPFQADSAVSVAIMQLSKEAVMPRKINPAIPVGIEQITMRAMQKSPRDRYQSASEMLLDLDEFRRNPNTRFNYNYFVDTQPTKYVRTRTSDYASGKLVTDVNSEEEQPDEEYIKQTVITQEYEELDAELEKIANKNYTLPILIGIIFVFMVAVVGIASYFFTNTEEITVPEFVGKYIDEIRDDSDYKYFFDQSLIEENLVYTTDYDEGYIFYQSVEAGTKMQISSTSSFVIKLNIAYTSEEMTVPEMEEGIKLQQAKSKLQKMGFKVVTEGVVDNTVDASTVLRTDPPAGQSVAYGATITIYYAVDDSDKVAVPYVVGVPFADAKSELEALGFKVRHEYKESDAENDGLVISQSIASDTTVIASLTEITIVVGVSDEKITSVTVTLPALADYGDIYESVYVYVGETLYKTYNNVKLDGTTHTVELGGSENTDFKIYVGEQLFCEGKVDFTKSPAEVTDKTVNQYKYEAETTTAAPETTTAAPETTTAEPEHSIPAYTGKTYEQYFHMLTERGFDNIEKLERSSDTVPEGQVVAVAADKTVFTADEVADALIRVYVSTGPEAEE